MSPRSTSALPPTARVHIGVLATPGARRARRERGAESARLTFPRSPRWNVMCHKLACKEPSKDHTLVRDPRLRRAEDRPVGHVLSGLGPVPVPRALRDEHDHAGAEVVLL